MVDSYRVQSYERRQTAQTLDAIFSKVYFRIRLRFMTVRKIGDDIGGMPKVFVWTLLFQVDFRGQTGIKHQFPHNVHW